MSDQSFPPMNERLSLKQTTGWFPAGDAFRKALTILSDGAFKLFAYLCLEADKHTGSLQATHKELALAMGKSKRAIGSYIAELEAREICHVSHGKNQFAHTTFEISDSYWPYRRSDDCPESPEQKAYVESVRACFLSLGCGSGKFGITDASGCQGLATTRHSACGGRGSYAHWSLPEIQFLVRGQRTGTYPKPAVLRSVDCRNPKRTVTLGLSGISSRKDQKACCTVG